jgi:hypothetical protein
MPRLSKFGEIFDSWQYVANPACLDCEGEEVHENWGVSVHFAVSDNQLSSRIQIGWRLRSTIDSAISDSLLRLICYTDTLNKQQGGLSNLNGPCM